MDGVGEIKLMKCASWGAYALRAEQSDVPIGVNI